MAIVFSKSGAITADTQWEFPPLDLSIYPSLLIEILLESADGVGTDLLNIYLQCRGQSGVWVDRVASHQFAGDNTDAELRQYVLQALGSFSDTEEAHEPSGSAGASHLTTATVLNGPFPGRYHSPGVGTLTAWRFDFDKGGAGSPTFNVKITVHVPELG